MAPWYTISYSRSDVLQAPLHRSSSQPADRRVPVVVVAEVRLEIGHLVGEYDDSVESVNGFGVYLHTNLASLSMLSRLRNPNPERAVIKAFMSTRSTCRPKNASRDHRRSI